MRIRRRPIKAKVPAKANQPCDKTEFLDCVRYLHEEAQRLGYIDLSNILAQTFDDCAEAMSKGKCGPDATNENEPDSH